jgi:hypothetical protein
MALGPAGELISRQSPVGGGYNRNVVRLVLGEVQRAHGQQAAAGRIRQLDPENAFGPKPGTDCARTAGQRASGVSRSLRRVACA